MGAVLIQDIEIGGGGDGTEPVRAGLVLADSTARRTLDEQWRAWWAGAKARFTKAGKVPAYFRGKGWQLAALEGAVSFPRRVLEFHVVERADDKVHGLIVTSLPGDRIATERPALFRGLGALSGVDPSDLLWVEYIAIAPWLRPDDNEARAVQRARVGTQLMKVAIRRALSETSSKCVALHAQGAEARGVYRSKSWNMLEDGRDPDEKPEDPDEMREDPDDASGGYCVFAFDPVKANSFLVK